MNTPGPALAKLRKLAGKNGKALSQVEFSRMTGTPVGSLARIERGRAPLPESSAWKIEATFGCLASALIEGELKALDGSPYNSKHLRLALTEELPAKHFPALNEDIASRVKMVLEALGPHRVFYGAARIRQALDSVIEESGITYTDLYATARKHSKLTSEKMTVGKIRKDAELRGLLGSAVAKFKPAESVTLFTETFDRFPPSRMEAAFLISAVVKVRLISALLPDGKEVKLTRESINVESNYLGTNKNPPKNMTIHGVAVDHLVSKPSGS